MFFFKIQVPNFSLSVTCFILFIYFSQSLYFPAPPSTQVFYFCFSEWSRLCSKLLAAFTLPRKARCSYASHFTSVLREEKTENSDNCSTQEYRIEVKYISRQPLCKYLEFTKKGPVFIC